jgi:hypothetical protein
MTKLSDLAVPSKEQGIRFLTESFVHESVSPLSWAIIILDLYKLFIVNCSHLTAVRWQIQDVYPGIQILIFIHPGSPIPDPGSRIPYPKTATKESGEKKICCYILIVATNTTKLKTI